MTLSGIRKMYIKHEVDQNMTSGNFERFCAADNIERFILKSSKLRQSFFVRVIRSRMVARLGTVGPGSGNQLFGEVSLDWFLDTTGKFSEIRSDAWGIVLATFYAAQDQRLLESVDGTDIVLRSLEK